MKYSIGTTYEGKDFTYLNEILPFVNHIEVSPDSITRKKNGAIKINEETLEQLEWVQNKTKTSLLLHGVGLSIGSYEGYSSKYIHLLDELFNTLNISWHSEHLAYTIVNGENIGTMLTLPRTDEVIEMICRRIDTIQKRFKVPFLIENVISMLPDSNCKYSEAEFLNKITKKTGCGLILDVYNIECDEVNFKLDVNRFIEELNLDSVVELHLAGGLYDTEFNFQMDIHAGTIAESTINLASQIIDKEPKNLKAITFEILEEFIPQIGSRKIINEINKLNLLFNHNGITTLAN